uniref:Major facilitator superfamily (MFS) profile domain-containing protein n=1 Tax=Bionectria ochroleuca TaxID=29856 RepID=A0A8H7K2H1_BIOOC
MSTHVGSQPQANPDQKNTASTQFFEPDEKHDNSTRDDDSHRLAGVSKVEAFNKVLYQSGKKGKILLWLLGVSVGLTMFAYALDMGITTTIFGTLATSTFGVHSQLGTVNTASQIIRAISKPFIGKLADITSRPTTYVVILAFYTVGFAVAASAYNFILYYRYLLHVGWQIRSRSS